MKKYLFCFLAYMVPGFIIAYFWHLKIFADFYHDLEIYRENIIVPLGFLSMMFQGIVFSLLIPRLQLKGSVMRQGLTLGVFMSILAWTYTTLAVAAKYPMTSVYGYILIETCFTALQNCVAGMLMIWIYRR